MSLRYAVIGTGHRAQMYLDAIGGPHADVAELVVLADSNPGRAEVHRRGFAQRWGREGTLVLADPGEVEAFVAEHRIDRVIVTTPDYLHAEYIVRALEAGADVVVEKPLTIDAEGCRAISAAVERTGRSVVVTFNYRYSPRNSALKQVIASGEIGRVLSVSFEWVLDTAHGADYFRRWHRDKANSGGLLVHKSSHHFDLVNWWLADVPERVYASGGVRFYGAEAAERRGLAPRPERGTHDGPHSPFELDLRTDPRLKELYLDQEHHDGYRRDQDVFAAGVTTEDNVAVIVDYASGATLSYALNAHSPWEGYRVAVNGTLGRAELEVIERSAVLLDDDGNVVLDPSAVAERDTGLRDRGERLTVQLHFESAREVDIAQGEGGHGGGDAYLLADVFEGPGEDPLGRPSDYRDGIRAVAVGICGNESLATRQAVDCQEFLGVPLS